jgi:hypothetical protein
VTPAAAAHARGILDTSVAIDLPRLIAASLPAEPHITTTGGAAGWISRLQTVTTK